MTQLLPGRAQKADALDRRIDDAPAVIALDRIHDRAIASRASDIHIESGIAGGRIRLRIDGIVGEDQPIAPELFAPVVSRIKLLAGMDIADRRQPQDGRYAIERSDTKAVDARVSSIPTLDGETLVIRLLDPSARGPLLNELGMCDRVLDRYRTSIAAPYGFIVVSGPTGSGKTTTLYASLHEIRSSRRSVCSVEDPVEVRVDGVTQVQINVRGGLGFLGALRAILRQDPNVIMIGEMRDAETAGVGIGASLSGQLVLTTLHSGDALRTIARLTELGVSRHAIAAALSVVLSQRLVRRLCVTCRKPESAPRVIRELFPATDRIYVATGCALCGATGYHGRIGIFELLEVDEALREAIVANATTSALADNGRNRGYQPMRADGLAKVAAGATTLDELARVLPWP